MIAFIGGGLVLLLPETKGKALPETLEDAENMHRYDMEDRPHGAGQLSFASARPGKENCLVTIRHQGALVLH